MTATAVQERADDRLMETTMTWLRAVLVPPAGTAEPASRPPSSDHESARQARRRLEEALAADPAPRFTRLCDSLGMGAFERDVALLCLAHALSTEVARLCAAMPESRGGAPTFALAMALAVDEEFDAAAPDRQAGMTRVCAAAEWNALSPDRPLRHWRLLEVCQPPGSALISGALRMDERVVNHLRGLDHLDDRLLPLVVPVPPDHLDTLASATQRARLVGALERLDHVSRRRQRLLVQLPGGDPTTKRLMAQCISGAVGRRLHRVSLPQLPPGADLSAVVDLWNREVHLQDVALLVDAGSTAPDATQTLARLLDGLTGLVFLDVQDAVPRVDTALVLDVARPEAAEQRSMWGQVLPDGAGEWPARLAGQFDLNLGEIVETAASVGGDELSPGEVAARTWDAQRARARPRLEGLAQRVTADTRLDDVQLPDRERGLLRQIADQTRYRVRVYDEYGFRGKLPRGLGITALFSGESGTGKTMAAEGLADELRLDLYRVDLASVVSKYIGETEKNLRQVFDAAEQSGAVLLFDEADALFGRRSEVQDSHDRYANIEVSYLLQRMEAYRGLAILTTNMRSALDPAFLRRLRFVVPFPFPGPDERERIWRGVFPTEPGGAGEPRRYRIAGVHRIDTAALARPGLTGGQIRNIALDAAFLAAAGDGVLTMELLRAAAREELRKGGRPFVGADFAAWVTPDGAAPAEVPS
ncbi:ATPase family associated with various cellular activities (AAA) [Geodermatophilus pulveris]|uniref:ATPase family associated with various cellular activities (AAA) n=1 Tax=Geodermatophilus pulveris TaxID=1564159 RepID=A0A239C3Z3_9ACTN|nr:ATP-binding protein [Geodermatophilus pulveris]SNS14351.1 ATPase family associated with various cellular activities (AAA) [Geodermatophilus pulveris]